MEKIKKLLAELRDSMERYDLFQEDDEVGTALSELENEVNKLN